MAGNTSIGRLNVILSASANDFDKAINGAEKRLTGFAAKAATLGGLTSFGSSISSLITNPIATVMNPIGGLIGALPGAGLAMAESGLGNVSEATERATERLRTLEREANRVGVAAGQLRGLQLFAGAEADNVAPMLGKMTKMLGQLRAGDATVGNENSITKLLGKHMDVATLKAAEPLDAFKMLIDASHNTGDAIERNTILFTAFGKAGLSAAGMAEKGTDSLTAAMEKAAKLYSEGAGAVAGRIRAAEKELKLRKEAADIQALFIGEAQSKADLAWAGGEGGNWARAKWQSTTRWLDQAGHWFGKMIGAPTSQGPSPGENWLAKQSSAAGGNAASEVSAAGQAAFDAVSGIDKLNEALEKQIKYFGLSADAAKMMEAASKGATASSLAQTSDYIERLSLLNKAQRFADEAAPAIEKLATQFEDLSNAMARGAIAGQPALNAIGRLVAEANRMSGGSVRATVNNPSVLSGTQEAARLIDQGNAPVINGLQSLEDLKRFFAEQKGESQKGNKFLEDIYKAIKNGGAKTLTGP